MRVSDTELSITLAPLSAPHRTRAAEALCEIIDKTALGRLGSPADVARTALFLVRDAPYVTSQIIAVDGGRSI